MKKVAIIGAGISGLFIANLFKKNPNYQISIYEKNTSLTLEQGYGVQLSVNSIRILNEIGFRKFKDNENLIFVTHYVVISEALDYAPSSGEIVVADKNFNKIGSIEIDF